MRARRALVVALTIASVVILYAKHSVIPRASAGDRHRVSAPVLASPTPTPSPTLTASAKPTIRPSVKASATPSPSGPPFVLDAAPSCAGSTALIDVQVAANAKRPIVKLELLLDDAEVQLTPAPSYPLTQYAGRSSGQAATGGSGQWILRATDAKGISEAEPFPYACG